MAIESLKMSKPFFVLYLFSCLIGFIQCGNMPKLEILPVQEIQRQPVGKSLILTCRPVQLDTNLISNLQWRDNMNMTIPPKPTAQTHAEMYTEILPGDQNLTLIIPSLKETMAGRYYCSASYANTELLEIGVTIETYDVPEHQFAILGTSYIVRCKVTASPSPTVDWLRNGEQIKSGGNYELETTGLIIRDVQESHDGIYTCRIAMTHTGELMEKYIRFEVYIKPEISHLPAALEAIEGQAYSTFCNASGKPVPEIVWIKDKTEQNVATADRFVVNPLTGLLTINKVGQNDYGTYTCIARNDAGVTEAKTKLNVLVRPKIYELYNITGEINREVAIRCLARGRPAPEITFRRWESEKEFIPGIQRDDDRIILEQYVDNEKGESSGTLRITKLMRTDDGLYECIARNKIDTAYKNGHITVERGPDFTYTKSLPPVYTWEEMKANLSCLAESIPNSTIDWRWRGEYIRGMYDKNLVIEGRGPRSNLIVSPIDRRYYSTYKCVATNMYGTAEVDIQLKEGIVPSYVHLATTRAVTPTTITFDILGPLPEPGLPIIAYSVRFKEEINSDWSHVQKRDWSTDSLYTVGGLKPQTAYSFQFAARNQVGLGPWGANRIQSTPKRSVPEEPKTLHTVIQDDEKEPIVMSPYSDHFELRWSVPANNGEPIDFYQIKYFPRIKVNGEWSELSNECLTREVTETTTFEMSPLNPNTYYRIELRAHNSIGFSTPSSIMMKTARAESDTSHGVVVKPTNNIPEITYLPLRDNIPIISSD